MNTTNTGKSPKKEQKYDRELKRFRAELMEKIYLFKNARAEWFYKVDNKKVLTPTSSTVYYDSSMDKRRISFIKAMGLKLDMIQPHRRTLRPRSFFTLKKNTSGLNIRETMQAEDVRKKEAPIIKVFRKKIKEIRKELKKKKKTTKEKRPKKEVKWNDAEPDKFYDDELNIPYNGTKQESDLLNDDKGTKNNVESDTEIELEGKRKGDDDAEGKKSLSTPTDFESIMEDLEQVYDFGASGVTNADLAKMKKIWEESKIWSEENEFESRKERKKQNKLERLKSFKKICLNKGKLLPKLRKGKQVDWPPGIKPCTCQIAEGDKLIVMKVACNCSEQCDAKGKHVGNYSASETSANGSYNDVVRLGETLPETTNSGTVIGKIVDSLELIRKKVTPKSSQVSRANGNVNEEVRNGASYPTIKTLNDNELTKIKSDTLKRKLEEEFKNQEKEGSIPEKSSSSIIYIKNFRSKKVTKRPLHNEILSDQKDEHMKEEELFSLGNSVKEVKDMKPRKSLTNSTGRSEVSVDTVSKQSEDAGSKTQGPEPILEKGKINKKINKQGHVSFDIKIKKFSSGSDTYGGRVKKKTQTVMSVINMIKRPD